MGQTVPVPDPKAAVNAAVARDGSILRAYAGCINGRVPWSDWPADVVPAFLGAICVPISGNDAWKAVNLHWHLFRGASPEVPPGLAAPSREADRLRADLVALVKLGSGRYLVPALRQALSTHTS